LIKLLPYILFEKYTYILAMEMASRGNRHCANCIGALSFPMKISLVSRARAAANSPPPVAARCRPAGACARFLIGGRRLDQHGYRRRRADNAE